MLSSSTLSNNSANNGGGAYIKDGGYINFYNSTVTANSTSRGAGIHTQSGSATLSNSTVTGNSATDYAGGLYVEGAGTIKIYNTIIAGNTGHFAEVYSLGVASITSNGANLFGDSRHVNNAAAFYGFLPSVSDINANQNGDNIPLKAIIGSLSSNGGPTKTHALVANSPALDSANNADCTSFDQRGVARDDGLCDIGAVEGVAEDATFVVPIGNKKSVIFTL